MCCHVARSPPDLRLAAEYLFLSYGAETDVCSLSSDIQMVFESVNTNHS